MYKDLHLFITRFKQAIQCWNSNFYWKYILIAFTISKFRNSGYRERTWSEQNTQCVHFQFNSKHCWLKAIGSGGSISPLVQSAAHARINISRGKGILLISALEQNKCNSSSLKLVTTTLAGIFHTQELLLLPEIITF